MHADITEAVAGSERVEDHAEQRARAARRSPRRCPTPPPTRRRSGSRRRRWRSGPTQALGAAEPDADLLRRREDQRRSRRTSRPPRRSQLIDSNGNVIGAPSAPDAQLDGFGLCAWATELLAIRAVRRPLSSESGPSVGAARKNGGADQARRAAARAPGGRAVSFIDPAAVGPSALAQARRMASGLPGPAVGPARAHRHLSTASTGNPTPAPGGQPSRPRPRSRGCSASSTDCTSRSAT